MAPSMTFHCDVLPKTRNCARRPGAAAADVGRGHLHARRDRQHREHVVPGRQDRRQLLGEVRGHHRVRDVDDRRVADDGDGFRHRRDVHHDVEGGGEAGRQLNAFADDGAEPRKLELHRVGARRQQPEPVGALLVGHRDFGLPSPPCCVRVRSTPGKRRARGIGDPPGDDAVLSPTGRCGDQQETHRDPDSPDVIKTPPQSSKLRQYRRSGY